MQIMTAPEIEARERRGPPSRKKVRRRRNFDYEEDEPEPFVGPGNEQVPNGGGV
jgi:hypothetical protein